MGKFLVGMLVLIAALAGGAMYYLQVYGYYEDVVANGVDDVQLVSAATGQPEPIPYDNFQAIDAQSSPIRYRACFTTGLGLETAGDTYVAVPDVTPRNAPAWFECFDATAIAQALDAGTAQVFLGAKNIRYGVDRIVAITDNGRGYVWHELNECGEKAYDGTVIGEECPPRP
jgi:hypothetical protein